MGFDWKSLIFEKEAGSTSTPMSKPSPSSSPNTEPGVTKSTASPSQSVLTDVLAVYERGFESLNTDGYDFFELYKAVMAVGADNPQAYTMAFAMGKGIKADLSKTSLLEKGRSYVAELAKVHAGYAQKGQAKLAELTQSQSAENQNLLAQNQKLEKQIADLQAALAQNKVELEKLDSKYAGGIEEMTQKIAANDQAKDIMVASIEKVLNGINQNL